MCKLWVVWYSCGCEGKTLKIETCKFFKANKVLLQQGSAPRDSKVVGNRIKCGELIDEGRCVEVKKYRCDKCQHIYTEETYGTERQESSM